MRSIIGGYTTRGCLGGWCSDLRILAEAVRADDGEVRVAALFLKVTCIAADVGCCERSLVEYLGVEPFTG